MNEQVAREVIDNLNIQSMETKVNEKTIHVFGKGWRQKMKVVFNKVGEWDTKNKSC